MASTSAGTSSTAGDRWSKAIWIRLAALAVVLGLAAWFLHDRIDPAAIHTYAARLNGFVVFGLLVVLPLLGFPASVLHVTAGIRFGLWLGLPLVALSIALQLLASYGLVHLFRDRFAHRFERLRQRIPRGAHASICVFAVLLPGAPFAAINYVLPLLGVRFRTYFLCCWPLHVLRSTVTVLLGDQTDKLTPTRVTVLAVYALLLAAASGWLYRRVRRQLADPPAAGDGPMLPA